MATLQRIRNHSVALLVIVGLAMLAFIIGDLLTSSSSIMQSARDKVVVVNGKKVTYEEFEAKRQRKTDFYKSMMGQELDNNASQQLTQEVYQEFVNRTLLDEACEDLGIAVTKEEINELVQGQNLSPVLTQIFGQQAPAIAAFFVNLIATDGFDEAAQQYPFATYQNWMEIEDMIVMNRKSQKLNALVAAAVKPCKLEAADNFAGDNTECTFAYVKQSAYQVADSLVSVSSSDVKAYFEANKRAYKLPTTRRAISYISKALEPSEADFAEAEQDIKAVREEFATAAEVADLVNAGSMVPYVDAFVAVSQLDPETREFVEANAAGAILEPHLTQGTYYMMARIMDKKVAADSTELALVVVPTQAEADSLKALLAGAADAQVALAGMPDQQKYIGWANDAFTLQQFGADVRSAIAAANTGSTFNTEVSVGADKAYYVGKIVSRTKPTELAKVAVYVNEVIPSSATRREEFGKLNQFLTEFKDIKHMQDSAQSRGFMMMPTTIYSNAYSIAGVQDARQAVRFAFQNKKGEVSEIFEAGDNLLVVAITGDVEEDYASVKDSILYRQLAQFYVMPEKKADYLAGKFAEVADKTLEGYAAAFSASIDTARFVNFNVASISGLGMEPKIIGAALKAEPGQVVTVAGKTNVVALKSLGTNDKQLTYDEAANLQAVANTREYQQAVNGALNILANEADILDNRINFY